MIDQKALSQYHHAFISSTDSSIAQSVEQRTVNPCVPGSSPGRGAKYIKPCSNAGLFCFLLPNLKKLFTKLTFKIIPLNVTECI
jgi:hypothetical protein